MDNDPIPDQRVRDRRPGPDRAVASNADARPDHGVGAIMLPEPISASGPITAPGSMVTPASRARRAVNMRMRRDGASSEQRRGPQHAGKQRARYRHERSVGFAREQHGNARRRVFFEPRVHHSTRWPGFDEVDPRI